jgi:D-cysteine desulfhydrase
MGYVEMIGELKEQMLTQGVSLDSIVCPVGSGGTFAGVLMGIALYGLPVKAFGVNVQRDARYFVDYMDGLFEEAVRNLGFPIRVTREEIQIIEGYVGLGYGLNTEEELSLITGLAQEEGIILDPVYTGKTFHALDDALRTGKGGVNLGERILFIHTGGIFGLFPKWTELEKSLTQVPRRHKMGGDTS